MRKYILRLLIQTSYLQSQLLLYLVSGAVCVDEILRLVSLVHVLQHLVERDRLATRNVHTADQTELALVLVGLDSLPRGLDLAAALRVFAEDGDPGQDLGKKNR